MDGRLKMSRIHSHCSYCGAKFEDGAGWPRTCASCSNTSFLNPVPVTVVQIPVGPGLLVIRRAIEPRKGLLALPGGYVNFGETWQEAGAREVFEETGVVLNPEEIREFAIRSGEDGTIILFGISQPVPPDRIPPFTPNRECLERKILTEWEPLAFKLHEEMIEAYFGTRPEGRCLSGK
ncbi:MAG: NUDIX domain-containing protein [Desulfobacteraceae bacterium]|nr:NUDIX domain-containing protein [Desulfobacteraceae bacterium]